MSEKERKETTVSPSTGGDAAIGGLSGVTGAIKFLKMSIKEGQEKAAAELQKIFKQKEED